MQTNCNAYTADVVVLHFIGDNITLYLKYRNQIGSMLLEIALKIYLCNNLIRLWQNTVISKI